MLTPDTFRSATAGLVEGVRGKRLSFPADQVPPQQIFLFDAVGEVMQMLIMGEPVRKAPQIVERAVTKHRAVAAVLIGEAYLRETPVDAPRYRGSFADLPDSEEVMLVFSTWPQAGIGEIEAFTMLRTAFGTLDLVRREFPAGPGRTNRWLSDVLPQKVAA